MRSLGIKVAMALLVLGIVVAATPALAQPARPQLELLVRGRGVVTGGTVDCTADPPGGPGFLFAECNLNTAGDLVATHLGFSTFTVEIRTGTTPETNFDGGHCFPANRSDFSDGVFYAVQIATLTAANGDIIRFNTVGKLCEELGLGSSLQYIADYRITGGTGRFSDARGGGSLALTVDLVGPTKEVFLHMHGNIRYAGP